MPLGNLLAGGLVRTQLFSVPTVVALDGTLLAVVALYFLVVQRRVAQL
jgi:hypothetical protein